MFDVPAATVKSPYETDPHEINSRGEIVGSYTTNFLSHGFLREANGSIRTFDVPNSTETAAFAIDFIGRIVGDYTDARYIAHGFLRQIDGNIMTFDVPNAVNTIPTAMSSWGEIAGTYTDASGGQHGFIMIP